MPTNQINFMNHKTLPPFKNDSKSTGSNYCIFCYSSYHLYKNKGEITPLELKCDLCQTETLLEKVTFVDV
jgi:hypothetical protein